MLSTTPLSHLAPSGINRRTKCLIRSSVQVQSAHHLRVPQILGNGQSKAVSCTSCQVSRTRQISTSSFWLKWYMTTLSQALPLARNYREFTAIYRRCHQPIRLKVLHRATRRRLNRRSLRKLSRWDRCSFAAHSATPFWCVDRPDQTFCIALVFVRWCSSFSAYKMAWLSLFLLCCKCNPVSMYFAVNDMRV